VRHGSSPAQRRSILDIIDPAITNEKESAYSNEALWSMETTERMMARWLAGTFSHLSNASISADLISFPGCVAKYLYGPSTNYRI
jgi:hypothetical protein